MASITQAQPTKTRSIPTKRPITQSPETGHPAVETGAGETARNAALDRAVIGTIPIPFAYPIMRDADAALLMQIKGSAVPGVNSL